MDVEGVKKMILVEFNEYNHMKIRLQAFLYKESCKTSTQVEQISNTDTHADKSDSSVIDKEAKKEIVLEDNTDFDKGKNKCKIGLRKRKRTVYGRG